VTEAVVDELEAVQVEHQHRHLRPLAQGECERLGESVGKERAIRQSGQRIVSRPMPQLLVGVFEALSIRGQFYVPLPQSGKRSLQILMPPNQSVAQIAAESAEQNASPQSCSKAQPQKNALPSAWKPLGAGAGAGAESQDDNDRGGDEEPGVKRVSAGKRQTGEAENDEQYHQKQKCQLRQ
jgi:hypothetical protein